MTELKRPIWWAIMAAIAFAVSSNTAHAQLQPIVIGGGDIPDSSEPSNCERDLGKDPEKDLFERLIHSLCQRGDADSLLAVYLFTMPGFGSRGGKFDTRTLKRAYAVGKTNPKLLWVVTTQTECVGPLQGCKSAKVAVEAAQALTKVDPDNAMAWFALARAEDMVMTEPDKVDAALNRAAKAGRVHDYTFDLTKLAEKASTGIPAPTGVDIDDARLARVGNTTMMSIRFFNEWAVNCSFLSDSGDPDRKKFCEAAREQFKHGDSRLTLSGDAKAAADMQVSMQQPTGISNIDFDKIMLESIRDSASEREWYGKIKARLRPANAESK